MAWQGWAAGGTGGGRPASCAPAAVACPNARITNGMLTLSPLRFPRCSFTMLQLYKDLDLEIPEGVTVELHARQATVKGPRGELTKVSGVGEQRETRQLGARERRKRAQRRRERAYAGARRDSGEGLEA